MKHRIALLIALPLAPLAALRAGRALPDVPGPGKLRTGFF
jgi:hypothetical protein